MSAAVTLRLDAIQVDGGTQARFETSDEWVSEIAEAIERGDNFPPVIVFYDGTNHWLTDGFHRYRAHKNLGRKDIQAVVKPGTRRDAIL